MELYHNEIRKREQLLFFVNIVDTQWKWEIGVVYEIGSWN